MLFRIRKSEKGCHLYIVRDIKELPGDLLQRQEAQYILKMFRKEQLFVELNRYENPVFIFFWPGPDNYGRLDAACAAFISRIRVLGVENFAIIDCTGEKTAAFLLGKALIPVCYIRPQLTRQKERLPPLKTIYFSKESISQAHLKELEVMDHALQYYWNAVFNPAFDVSFEGLSQYLSEMGREGLFRVGTFNDAKLKQSGAFQWCYQTGQPVHCLILEHHSPKAEGKSPLALVAPVYTGGVPDALRNALLLAAVLYVAGSLDLPLNIVCLIPVLDFVPFRQAVFTRLMNGQSILLGKDSAQELALPDAMLLAQKYRPFLSAAFVGNVNNGMPLTELGSMYSGNIPDAVSAAIKVIIEQERLPLAEWPVWHTMEDRIQANEQVDFDISSVESSSLYMGPLFRQLLPDGWLCFYPRRQNSVVIPDLFDFWIGLLKKIKYQKDTSLS